MDRLVLRGKFTQKEYSGLCLLWAGAHLLIQRVWFALPKQLSLREWEWRPDSPHKHLKREVRQDRGPAGLTETVSSGQRQGGSLRACPHCCWSCAKVLTAHLCGEDIRSCPSILVSLPQWDLCSSCLRACSYSLATMSRRHCSTTN